MAKHNGITIRLGAAFDEVDAGGIKYDRAEMRKAGAHKAQGTLRRGVVEAWSDTPAGRRAAAKERDKNRSEARRSKRQRHELQDA